MVVDDVNGVDEALKRPLFARRAAGELPTVSTGLERRRRARRSGWERRIAVFFRR